MKTSLDISSIELRKHNMQVSLFDASSVLIATFIRNFCVTLYISQYH